MNQINSHKGRGVLMIIAASVVGAIIVAGAVILAFTLLKKSNETSARSVGTSKSSFQAAQDKLVIIECGGGSGSGFLAKMDGKVYLVSNEHVLRGAGAPKATLLNGEILTLGAFSVAEDRDLARFEIPGATKGFEISTADPSEGEQCTIYGDTGGVGVMGSSQGVILARGDKFVETDAGIAHGASGGPALNAKGFVFGAVDWGGDFTGTDPHAKGTRYDGMRRFLVRLDRTVKWKTINRDEYEYQAYVFDSVDLFLQKLMPFLIFDDPQNPSEDIPTFSELDAKMFAPDKFGFAENLLALSTACEKFSISFMKYFQLNERWKALNERLVSQHADDETCKKATENFIAENNPDAIWAKVITDLRSLTTKRRQVLGVGRTVLAETRWDSPQYMHGHTVDDNQHMGGSITHFRQLIGYYDEVMQQRMRDWEKKFKFEEGRYDDED